MYYNRGRKNQKYCERTLEENINSELGERILGRD